MDSKHRKWYKKLIAWVTLINFLLQPVLAAAQTVADPNAPNQKKPTVATTANGIPVVQIATPSAAGVSHNLYLQFDVDPHGLILNNSYNIIQTQLAGYVIGNPNLAGGSARIILNEVTGTNISQLKGYLEVAGPRAEVIIANPNGILGNGFGFINTSRAVLTTGRPVFGGSGSLDAFRVTGGQIAIQGNGMDASTTDRADIISRAVSVNAGIWGKELNVVIGANQVNYTDLSTQKITGDASQPTVAIDVAALGGMYANKIRLVGTEAGVGVNSQGTLSANSGDLTLTNEGKVTLAGSTLAAGQVTISAANDVANQGNTYAQGNTIITTAGTLTNTGVLAAAQNTSLSAQTVSSTGTLGAGIDTNGNVGGSGDLTINATGAVIAKGKNLAGGNLAITGSSIEQSGATTYAGGSANITATNGDVNHTGANMQAGGPLTINATGTVTNDKDVNGNTGQITASKVTITAGNISNKGGSIQQTGSDTTTLTAVNSIDNTGGTIATNGASLSIQAGSVTNNQGQIRHAGTGTFTVQTTGDLQNINGSIVTNGQATIQTENLDNTQGTLAAQQQMGINAASLTNTQGTVTSGDAVNIATAGAVSNQQGTIEANKGLNLTAQLLNNQGGSITNLDTSDTKLTVTQGIQNQSGLIGGNGNVAVAGQSLTNQGGQVVAKNNLTVATAQSTDNTNGTLSAGQDLNLNQSNANLTNTSGTISAGSNLNIQTAAVDNANGSIAANKDINLTAQRVTGNGQAIAGQDLNVTVSGDLTNTAGGQLKANRNVNLAVTGTVTNQGNITGVQNMTVTGGNITNDTGATTAAGNELKVSASGDLNNNGQLDGSSVTVTGQNVNNVGILTADVLTVQASSISNSTGAVMNSTGDINLNATADNGSLTNQGTIYTRSNANINTAGGLNNTGVLAAANNTAIAAQTVSSTGTFGAGINSNGSVGSSGDLTITATGTVTAKGKNLSGGNLGITGTAVDQSGSTTYAGGAANITATNGDVNNTGANLQAGGNLSLGASGAVKNDKDATGNIGQITANKVTITANDISNKGGSIRQTGSDTTNLTAANSIDNTSGTIATNGSSLSIQATGPITNNQGNISHAGTGTLTVKTSGDLQTSSGTIATNGQADIQIQNIDNTKGAITAQKELSINTASLTNNQGTIAGGDAITITTPGAVNNRQGAIQADKGLTLTAQSLDNTGGSVINLDSSDTKVTVSQTIQNQSGLLGGNGNVDVTGQNLLSQDGQVIAKNSLTITAVQGTDNTNGTLSAGQDLNLNQSGSNLTNAGGTISAGNTLNVQATGVDNTGGSLTANKDVNLTAQSLSGNGQALAGQDLNITLNGDLTNTTGGQLKANRNVNLAVDGAVQNQGSITGVQNVTVTGSNVTNGTGATTAAGGQLNIATAGDVNNNGRMDGNTVTVNGQNVNNTGTVTADTLTVQAGTINNTGAAAVMNSTGDINLNATASNGSLTNQGTIYAQGNANMNAAGTVANSGVIAAAQKTVIAAQSVSSTGAFGAGIKSNGSISNSGDLNITATGAVTARQNLAGGNLTVIGTSIDQSGATTYAGSAANIKATNGDVNHTGGYMKIGGPLTLSATGAVKNDKDADGNAGQITAGNVAITADSISNKGGSILQTGSDTTNLTAANGIDNTSGTIATNGSSLTLQGSTLTNTQGQIQQAGTGTLLVNTTGDLINIGGSIASNGQATIQAGNVDNTQGTVTAQKQLVITAASLTNNQGLIAGGDAVSIMAQVAVNNQQGVIQANKGLALTAQSLNNQGGKVINLGSGDTNVAVNQGIQNQSGLIGGNGNVSLSAQSLANQGGRVQAQGNINIAALDTDNTNGTVSAGQDVSLNQSSANLTNTSGTIGAGRTLSVQTATVDNTGGSMAANQDINLTAQSLSGNGQVIAGQDLNLTLNGDLTNGASSKLQANRNINLIATGTVTNQGTITAVQDVNLSGNIITNDTGAAMSAGNALNLTAASNFTNNGTVTGSTVTATAGQGVINTGAVMGNNITVTADSISNNGASAVIASNGDTNLYARTSLENKDDATIYSTNNINIAGSADKDFMTGEYTFNTGSVLNQSATIQAGGNIAIYADTLTNKMRSYTVDQTLVSQTRYDQYGVYQANDFYYSLHGNRNYYFVSELINRDNGEEVVVTVGQSSAIGLTPYIPYQNWPANYTPTLWLLSETVTDTTVNSTSPAGKIMAGDNMKIRAGTINNDMSQILANGTLDMTAGTVNNTATGNIRTTTRQIVNANEYLIYSSGSNNGNSYNYDKLGCFDSLWNLSDQPSGWFYSGQIYGYLGSSYYDTVTEQLPGSQAGIIGGGQNVSITARNINNLTVTPGSVAVNTNGLTPGQNQGTVQTINGTSATQTVNIQGTSGNITLNPGNVPVSTNGLSSSGQNQNTVQTLTNNTAVQTVNIQTTSGNTSVNSGNVPVSSLQTVYPSASATGAASVQQTTGGGNITIPSNAMFNVHPESTAHYLVETDPRFTNYNNFISSDYMLKQLNFDPAKTMKQVGDGFYEQQLVRDQIVQLTGRQVLSNYSSNMDEFKALMDNGTTYAKQFNLQVGVALTAEQMAQLTSDMVWLVEKDVDGQKVLVPVVYLAHAQADELKPSGALITGDNVQLTATGDVNNAGAIKADNQAQISAANITNYGGTIDGGNSTQLTAAQDIANFGGSISGGQVQLTAGHDVKAETISFTSTLPFSTTTIAGNVADITAGQNLSIQAGQDISVIGAKVSAGQDAVLDAGRNLEVGAVATQDRLAVGSYLKDTTSNVTSSIQAGNNLSLVVGQDTVLNGVKVSVGNDLALSTGRNLEVSSVQQKELNSSTGLFNTYSISDSTTNVTSNIQAGGSVSLVAGQDANLRGAQVTAGNDLALTAGGNINLSAVKDEKINDQKSLIYDGWQRTRTDDETVIGTNLQGGGQVTVAAVQLPGSVTNSSQQNSGHVTIAGSNITSQNGRVTIAANKDVTLKEETEKHESLVQTHTVSSGFFSSTTTDTLNYSLVNQVKGSTVSGNSVDVTTGNDLTVQGSNVVGTGDVNLTAGNNINITTAQENSQTENYVHTKKSGIFGGGGLGFTIGSQSQKLDTTNQTVTQVASTIGSTNGQVNILANKDTNITGSDIIGAKGINVTAQNITIDAATNTSHTDQTYEFHQSGLTVSLGSNVVTAIDNTASAINRSGNVEDSRLKTLYDYKAYDSGKDAIKDIKDISKGGTSAAGDWKLSISLGSTSQKSETVVDETWAQGSTLTSSGDINLTATGSGAKDANNKAIDGDLNLIAATVTGQNVNLSAVKDVNLQSTDNTNVTNYTSSSKSSGIGVEFNLTKPSTNPGFFVSASKSSDNSDENIVNHTNTVVTAQDTLTITSGSDTNIVGAQANGNTVKVDVGGNLNIASQQDVDNYTERSSSAGGTIGIGMPSMVSVSKGKTDSTYASVTGQSGIFAGNGGFDINVGGNTDLTGAVIASTATPDKNTLSTDTLTFSDIQNKADYSASSFGAGYSWGNGPLKDKDGTVITDPKTGKPVDNPANGSSYSPGMPVSGDASSTTKSAISSGTIDVRSGNVDLSQLNRNTNSALNALGKIFDKETVQERQELVTLFGQEAFKAVGDLAASQREKALKDAANYPKDSPAYNEAMARADSWNEGGANKILLHAIAGGIMSDLGGSSFASGAASAGLNEAVQKELSKIKDAGVHELASALIGAAAAKVVGGNAQVGASVAASATKNNWLDHTRQEYYANKLRDALKQGDLFAAQEIIKEASQESARNAGDFTLDEAIESRDNDGAGLLEQLQRYAAATGQTLTISNGLNLNLANFSASGLGYLQNPSMIAPLTGNTAYDAGQITNIRTANNLVAAGAPIIQGSDGIKYVRQINEDGSYQDYRVPNQDSVTVDPNVQKAFELQAAGAQVVANPNGSKYVREWHADGTFQDYYLPNQNVALTPELHNPTPEEERNSNLSLLGEKPIYNIFNDAKITITGTDLGGYIPSPGKQQDAKISTFFNISTLLIPEAKVSALSTETEVGTQVANKAGNVVAQDSSQAASNAETAASEAAQTIPGRVQSRINLKNGSASEGEGWEHVLDRHFDPSVNASQFTVTPDELRGILQSDQVVGTSISRVLESAKGPRYLREVDLGRTIGVDKFTGQPTSIITVLTDKFGNLVTATPGVIK